jgi:hypothetical protein
VLRIPPGQSVKQEFSLSGVNVVYVEAWMKASKAGDSSDARIVFQDVDTNGSTVDTGPGTDYTMHYGTYSQNVGHFTLRPGIEIYRMIIQNRSTSSDTLEVDDVLLLSR